MILHIQDTDRSPTIVPELAQIIIQIIILGKITTHIVFVVLKMNKFSVMQTKIVGFFETHSSSGQNSW